MASVKNLQQLRELFAWDSTALRYRSASGQFVSADAVRSGLRQVVKAAGKQINALAAQLSSGGIGLGQWQAAMEQAVKELHLAATVAGKGGFASMTPRDYGLAGARLRFHYERIDVFARMVEAGNMTAGQIAARAALYANGANGVYENSRREAAMSVMTQERRVLDNSEHCGVCVEEAEKGWQEIGSLRRLTDSPCKANCKCHFEFRTPRTR